MTVFLTVVHVMVCIMLIVIVLLQRGKGAEIGAVFGGGASTTVFGSRGAGNFLTKLTSAGAIVFMITSLSLAYISTSGSGNLFKGSAAKPAATKTTPFKQVPPPAGAAKKPEAKAPAATQPSTAESKAPATPAKPAK